MDATQALSNAYERLRCITQHVYPTLREADRRKVSVLKHILISASVAISICLALNLINSYGSLVYATETGVLRGVITDIETGKSIPRVTVRVEGTAIATLSNDSGQYRLVLPQGEYQLKFSHISYYSERVSLVVGDSAVTRDVRMRVSAVDIGSMRVYTRAYDPAQQIIVEAIRRKKDILSKIHDYRFDAYMKFVLHDNSVPDSSEIFLLAETQTTAYWEQPDKHKEVITARRQSANIKAENIIMSVGELLNFNRNRIELGDYLIVSPTAKDALDHYDYYLIDTIMVDGRRVYRLEMEPKNQLEPLFAGYVQIVDSTYDVVAVDLGFSEGVSFPFIANPHYSQQYAQFEDKYWMPVEIRFGGDVEIDFPFPGIPSAFSFAYVASLYGFEFERGHAEGFFDEYLIEVAEDADDLDSVTWNAGQTIPLTPEEVQAYKRIDSLENVPKPFGRQLLRAGLGLTYLLTVGEERIFHFNRVEGPYLGLGWQLKKLIPQAELTFRSGYAFDREYWQHRYGFSYLLSEKRRLRLGMEYHNEITRRETIVSDSSYNPSFLALMYKMDPFDYYREEGFELYASIRPVNQTRLAFTYSDHHHYSTSVNTDYSVFRRDQEPRSNPGIVEGEYRSVSIEFKYDSRKRFKDKGRERILPMSLYTKFAAGIEYASPDFIDNDFDFRRYYASLFRRQRLFGLGVTSLSAYWGSSDGDLPPQRYFTVDHGNGVFFEPRGFSTLDEDSFAGNRALLVRVNHAFPDRLFARTGLPLLRNLPFSLSVQGGVFWTEFRNHVWQTGDDEVRTARTAYSEIGFGLANLTPFLSPFNMAVCLNWQLSAYDTSRFGLQWGIKL